MVNSFSQSKIGLLSEFRYKGKGVTTRNTHEKYESCITDHSTFIKVLSLNIQHLQPMTEKQTNG